MNQIYEKLKEFGQVKSAEPLSKHLTFKIGGPAHFFVSVSEPEKIPKLFDYLVAQAIDYMVIAGGSNLLMSDRGFGGVVVKIATDNPPKLTQDEDIFYIESEAGVKLSSVVNMASKNSLSGIEWAMGIPGTFGGAIRGNAGAMGREICNILQWVEVWRDGEILRLRPEECQFGYRNSLFKHNRDIILRGQIALKKGDAQEILSQMQKNLSQRKHTPFPSAGSFFKNLKIDKWVMDKKDLPELFLQRGTVPVGWMNDQLGLRGLSVGGAKIADEHGNYIVNFNKATQEDVLNLVEKIKQAVYDKYGVELEPEVQIIK